MIQSGNFGRLLEPGLRKVFVNTYKEVPEQYTKVFKINTSDKAIETDLRVGGFGLWDTKGEADPVKYQDIPEAKALQYIHEEFASGFTVTRKMVDDAQYNTMSKMSAGLARSARATIETKAAEVFNTAFTRNGFDGVPLISQEHKRLDGGGMNNLLSAAYGAAADNGALSDKNLKAGILQARKQVDDRGILIQCNPKYLIVPPELEMQAKTIISSTNLSTLGNGSGFTNDKNMLSGRLDVIVLDYLTSSTAWFLLDPTVAELNFFWRKKLEFSNEKDFSTMMQKYQGYMRFSVGYSDYRGIVGSLGTGAA